MTLGRRDRGRDAGGAWRAARCCRSAAVQSTRHTNGRRTGPLARPGKAASSGAAAPPPAPTAPGRERAPPVDRAGAGERDLDEREDADDPAADDRQRRPAAGETTPGPG